MEFYHPKDPDSGRYLCSPENPMPKDAPKNIRWIHSNLEEVGEQENGYPSGDIVRYRCKDCGATWRQELPQ